MNSELIDILHSFAVRLKKEARAEATKLISDIDGTIRELMADTEEPNKEKFHKQLLAQRDAAVDAWIRLNDELGPEETGLN